MTKEEYDEVIAEAAARIRRTAFPAPTGEEDREHTAHSEHAEYGASAH
ncbi:hypothetical protein [Streptomyces sp. H39-S7]|nr:hypothetical protein [Streptomyces sp. H39-S7]MCZ4120993.1 hypothetical protein [Streptomyces sp. H39-S7]